MGSRPHTLAQFFWEYPPGAFLQEAIILGAKKAKAQELGVENTIFAVRTIHKSVTNIIGEVESTVYRYSHTYKFQQKFLSFWFQTTRFLNYTIRNVTHYTILRQVFSLLSSVHLAIHELKSTARVVANAFAQSSAPWRKLSHNQQPFCIKKFKHILHLFLVRGLKLKLRPLVRFHSWGGVLPIMAYTGRLRPKGVPFSGFRYKKG